MSEGIQDIVRLRKQLHELDLDITKLTGQANELRLAKETLERRAENAIPGAFPSTADGGETARRLLMGAELDVARQKIIEALEQI
jgi:hypothetical protein